MLVTTLAQIRAHGPCKGGYAMLTDTLGEDYGMSTPITLAQICASNKAADAIWALRACPGHERVARLLACRCAERALATVDSPDPRSAEAVRVARLHAAGRATDEELAAASAAAWAAAWASASAAASAAASASASATAWYAAWAAAWAAAWDDLVQLMEDAEWPT